MQETQNFEWHLTDVVIIFANISRQSFSALMLLPEQREKHLICKNFATTISTSLHLGTSQT